MEINRRQFTGLMIATLCNRGGSVDPADLPLCPEGFEWTFSPALKAHVPCPKGWHFHEVDHNGSSTAHFTREKYCGSEQFATGFSVNVVHDIIESFGGDVELVCTLLVEACLEGIQPLERFQDSNANYYTHGIEKINPPQKHGKEETRIRVVGVGNRRSKTLYLVQFEAPVSQWDADWQIGAQIYDMFNINESV